MSETKTLIFAVIAALLLGIVGANLLSTDTVKVEEKIKYVNNTIEVPVEVIKEVTVSKVPDFKTEAIDTVNDKLGDKDSFLTCGDETYDEDEVSISRVYEDYTYNLVDEDDGKYSVTFKARYEFEDGSDDSNCKEVRTYKVTYEDGEKPLVEKL